MFRVSGVSVASTRRSVRSPPLLLHPTPLDPPLDPPSRVRPSRLFLQVIKNVSTLFFDQPDLLHGRDGLEFFVPKDTKPPEPSVWFSWTPQTHHRYGRTSFRVAVRMLLLCEKRSRSQPPDLTKKKVRVERLGPRKPDGSDDSESEYSSSEESESDSESLPKEPGRVDERKIPPVWDQVTPRDLSEFERLTLEIKPMTDDQCWEDALSQKEETRQRRGGGAGERAPRRRGRGASPPESPPPPNGVAPRSRARIIAKVNRGATYTSYKHPIAGAGPGGRDQGHHHGGATSLTRRAGRGSRGVQRVHGRGSPAQGGRAAGAEEKPEGDVPDAADRAGHHPAGVHGEDRVLPRRGGRNSRRGSAQKSPKAK